jgi:hypothetical protein
MAAETTEDRKETMEDRKDSVEAEIDQAAEILGSRLMDSLQEYKQTHSLNNFDPEIEFLDNNLTKNVVFQKFHLGNPSFDRLGTEKLDTEMDAVLNSYTIIHVYCTI